MRLNRKFTFFCAMLGFLLVPSPIPVTTIFILGLILSVSGLRFAFYGASMVVGINGFSSFPTFLGLIDGVFSMGRGMWTNFLLKLTPSELSILQHNPSALASLHQVNGLLDSTTLPMAIALVMLPLTIPMMVGMSRLAVDFNPKLKRALQVVSRVG